MALTRVTTSVISTTTTGNQGQVLTAGTDGNLVWVNQGALSVDGANITGTVANASYATNAGTVTTASQPNITSVGNLTALSVTGNLTVGGDLTVNGNTVTVHSTEISIDDKNITLAANAANAAQANGGGITVAGANATMTYNSTSNTWDFNKTLSATIDGGSA